MRAYFRRRLQSWAAFANTPGLSPSGVAALYNAPKVSLPTGAVPTIHLIELGGGYDLPTLQKWCQSLGYPMPTISAQSIDGATNGWTGQGDGPDGEVMLDICVAIGTVFAMTGGSCKIVVVFAPNSDQGFLDAAKFVAGQQGASCGISWGQAEDGWTAATITAMDAAFAAGCKNGVTFCCAAGDGGSSDGEKGDHADYPGSSPYVLCCGGTSITIQSGVIVNEVPWNANGGATGGGYSAVEPPVTWQTGFVPTGKRRGVPDMAALADPSPGWSTPFGPIGGTSAVAPFMAAICAVFNCVLPKPLGQVGPTLYAAAAMAFRDLTAGSNGDMSAGKGWDPASGLGAPILDKLLTALGGSVAPPVIPPPVVPPPTVPIQPPTNPPAPVPVPTLAQVLVAVDQEFADIEEHTRPMVAAFLEMANSRVDKRLRQLYAQKQSAVS